MMAWIILSAAANLEHRFLNLGNPSRSLTTKDPAYDDYLPVDDQAFLDAVSTFDNYINYGRIMSLTYYSLDSKTSRQHQDICRFCSQDGPIRQTSPSHVLGKPSSQPSIISSYTG